MIIYGTKGSQIKSDKATGVKCNHCNQQTSHTITIFGKYFYIYWIPIFPLGKKGVSECNHCKVTYKPKEMSDQLKMAYDNVNRNIRTPLKYWTGSLIIACLIAFGIYSSNQHKSNVSSYISSPEVNDIIEYKSSDKAYSTLKITKVTSDSVFVVANSMEIAKKRKIYKIDKEENYNAEKYGISLTEYKQSFDVKKFLDVNR